MSDRKSAPFFGNKIHEHQFKQVILYIRREPSENEPNADIGNPSRIYVRAGLKRFIDIVAALILLIFFSPLMLIVAFCLVLQDGFPICYRHQRIGRDGQAFGCLKFRSMVKDSEERLKELLDTDHEAREEWESTQKLRNDPRVHPVGRVLRKSSLDELPQLINVIRGEMSMVGPRPIVTAEIARYAGAFTEYTRVRPGITGLWQISGRNDVSYEQRVALDSQYVSDLSLVRDLQIMLLTGWIMVTGKGY
jgi:lipopolysaccharide/colanic/teichoic acid biosynthesis glycosyltransferase